MKGIRIRWSLGMLVAAASAWGQDDVVQAYRAIASPLRTPDDLAELIRDAGARRLVLLGEATHGTREFYTWRAEISKRLVTGHGFHFVAVEGDWASLWRLNRYVTHQADAGPGAADILHGFDRWPRWMWANREFAEFAEWLRDHNRGLDPARRIGIYGKDVYDAWGAMDQVVSYYRDHLPDRLANLERRYAEFARHRNQPGHYARDMAARREDPSPGLRSVFHEIRAHGAEVEEGARDRAFAAKQAAYVVKAADRHYRATIEPGAASWNHRVEAMQATVERLRRRYGPESRGIVWAHNTHVGDARATSMLPAGLLNLGQLARETHGPGQVYAVGFATAGGRTLAARAWEGRREAMLLPPPLGGSLEAVLLGLGLGDALLRFPPAGQRPEALVRVLGHRAVGVVHVPGQDPRAGYVPTRPAARYDALLFIESTSALHPLHEREDGG